MTRPSDSNLSSHALLERAKHTLQSLQYHEQAARYKAAAAALQAAMVHAENGRPEVLQQWLERESNSWTLGLESSESHQSEFELYETALLESATDKTAPKRFMRIDQPIDRALVDRPKNCEELHKSPWAKMEQAACERLAKLNENQNQSRDEHCIEGEHVENKIESIQEECTASVPDWISESNLGPQTKPMLPMDWWRAIPIWASIGVHGGVASLLGLGRDHGRKNAEAFIDRFRVCGLR